jgi:hypothetical protein
MRMCSNEVETPQLLALGDGLNCLRERLAIVPRRGKERIHTAAMLGGLQGR